LVLVTDWQEFRKLDFAQLAQRMTTAVIIDGRNYLDAEKLTKIGFHYVGIGRPSLTHSPNLQRSSDPIAQVA
jgi:UDPglucose 6-dehydrogenase